MSTQNIILSPEEFKKSVQYSQATPMLAQYFEVKSNHQDCLVLFRMGDFYEMFFDDALFASKLLGLALAKRGQHAGKDIIMCGMPFHALDPYVKKLADNNCKIAICEQLESPEEAKKRGYKAVVKREVIRIITPGTIIEEELINTGAPNYLLSLAIMGDKVSISYVDVATAEIALTETKLEELASSLASLNPKEILLSEKLQDYEELEPIFKNYRQQLVFQVDSYFAVSKNQKIIEDFYKIKSIAGIGNLTSLHISALGALLEYLNITQKNNIPNLPLPTIINNQENMMIDASTRRHLEIAATSEGGYKGSLLATLNWTITKGGSRLLYRYLASPLINLDKIKFRLELTDFFYKNKELTSRIRHVLEYVSDLDRILTKISMKRATPKDLLLLADTLKNGERIKGLLFQAIGISAIKATNQILEHFTNQEDLQYLISQAIKEEAGAQLAEGGFIKLSYHPKVAELYDLLTNNQLIINDLRAKYRQITGIDTLKIAHNNLIGLFIEVTNKQLSKISDSRFVHRQTTVNGARFVTAELQELESKMVNARTAVINLEQELFSQICDKIMAKLSDLRLLASAFNKIDVFSSLGYLANQQNYTKPILTEEKELVIIDGRHPVVEVSLQAKYGNFTVNDCQLSTAASIWLITGPNMAGKSTFLKQIAIITLLAQVGSFVPASYAKIGITDRIFSRIGAADDLMKGLSTFMVEMLETSSILAQATARSLIILDEIGRGTAVYDGLSLAWAVLEHIHDRLRCRGLFATHYHELTKLADSLARVRNYTSIVEERDEQMFFSHKISAGVSGRSYGIQVAAMAGLPKTVIERAKFLLTEFENNKSVLVMPVENIEKVEKQEHSNNIALVNFVTNLSLDELTPRQALDTLYQIKELVKL